MTRKFNCKPLVAFWFVLPIALALVAFGGCSQRVTVQTAAVRSGEIREFVDEQAQTRLPTTYLITMPYDGRIEPIKYGEGAEVQAGDVVAQVIPADLDLAVKEAQAHIDRLDASIRKNKDTTVEDTTLRQAGSFVASMADSVRAAEARVQAGEAKLNFADKNLARIRTLREANNSTEEQLDAAELQHVQAQVDFRQDQLVLSALQSLMAATALLPDVVQQYTARKGLTVDELAKEKLQAQVRLDQQKRDEKRGQMASPVAGVVLERLETNERQVPVGTVLLKIGRLETMEIEADILSQDVVRVKAGQEVEVYGPAVGAAGAKGKVAEIYPAGFTKVSSLGVEQQRVKVVVRFADGELNRLRTEHDLGVGYRVRVRILTAQKPEALVVPRSALFRGPDNRWQLFAVRDGVAKLLAVEVGLMNDEQVEITSELKAGDEVVLAPESSLVDGTKVRAATK